MSMFFIDLIHVSIRVVSIFLANCKQSETVPHITCTYILNMINTLHALKGAAIIAFGRVISCHCLTWLVENLMKLI